MAPLTVTALIFHQAAIAESRGLPLAVFAAAFVGFAAVQLPTALIGGAIIDRYGSRWPLLLHLLPLALGVAWLGLVPGAAPVWAYLLLAGVTNALGALLRTVVVAELVPVGQLGAARGMVTAMMVVSTALGPALYGLVIEGAGIGAVLTLAVVTLLLAAVPALWVRAPTPEAVQG